MTAPRKVHWTGGPTVTDPDALTPVRRVGDYWFKRDDALLINGVRGGKVRTCWHLSQGAAGTSTAASRDSPQGSIAARVAAVLGIPCRVFVPSPGTSREISLAEEAGAELVVVRPGYNSVIMARAREDARSRPGWVEIPFGMECAEAVVQNRRQAANLPREARRLVVSVGSGMTLAGILWGLRDHDIRLPVLAVQVGAKYTERRLDRYGPPDWRATVDLVRSPLDYHEWPERIMHMGVFLDPVYEAKCVRFLAPGDCVWVTGVRRSMLEETDRAVPLEG